MMILFRKTRLRWTRRKIKEVQDRLSDVHDSICVSGDPEYTNAIIELADAYDEELQELIWHELYLVQGEKGWKPLRRTEEQKTEGEMEGERTRKLIDDAEEMKYQIAKQREAEEFTAMMEQAEDKLRGIEEYHAQKLSDKEAEVDVREVNRLIHELITMTHHVNNPLIMVSPALPPLHECSDECNEILLELEKAAADWKPKTAADLEQAARQKMAEEDPSLHGDLAMLLHRLCDPENHPVSLLALAEQAMSGECDDVRLVATAIDRLVDDYREPIGPRRNFEMSDRDCLIAMDEERGTAC